MVLTVVLVRGIRESARTNNILVMVKIVAILAFIFAAASFIKPVYWHPFMPNGWTGMLSGGSIIFFTYIGFDSVSTAAEECKRPQRDLPFGILATLVVCTLLYGGVAIVLSGMVPWDSIMGDGAPVVNALKRLYVANPGSGLHWVELVVLIGAMLGMISSILVFQLGQARVWFAMSRDRLLPDIFSGFIRSSARRRWPRGWRDSWWAFRRGCWISARCRTCRTSELCSHLCWCRSRCSSCATASRSGTGHSARRSGRCSRC